MGARFSRYKFALKAIGGAAVPDTSALGKYKKYANGEVTIIRRTTIKQKAVNYASRPFGLAGADDTKFLIQMSGRSSDFAIAEGIEDTLLNLSTPASETKNSGYVPAKAVFFVPDDLTVDTKTSQITGVAYKTYVGMSYTCPFGRATDSQGEWEVQAEILAQVAAETDGKTVTFKPERLRRN